MPAVNLNNIDESIDKGINYLYEHQLANGEFVCYFAPDEAMQEWCVPDSVTYITAFIGHCLLPIKENPQVEDILKKATSFLQYQMMRGGVWQYYTIWHRFFNYLPPDTDDTAVISSFLKKRGFEIDNLSMIVANKSPKGLFYTWFTIHPTFLKFTRTYWRLILRELKTPVQTLLYWLKGEHRRNDIDLIVNVNILHYLGYNSNTSAIVDFLLQTIESNKEEKSDKWYLNKFVYYYFISRLYELQITTLEEVTPKLIKKVLALVDSSNTITSCDLEIASALSSLIRMNCKNVVINKLASRLIASQQKNGCWQRYFLGTIPSSIIGWGSEELTTALAVEALHAYKNYTNPPIEQE